MEVIFLTLEEIIPTAEAQKEISNNDKAAIKTAKAL